jgi:hypothetical protein
MSDPSSEVNPLDRLAEEFVERYRRGERPALSEYVQRHPELADDIRDLFPGLVLMEGIHPEAGEATGPTKRPPPAVPPGWSAWVTTASCARRAAAAWASSTKRNRRPWGDTSP